MPPTPVVFISRKDYENRAASGGVFAWTKPFPEAVPLCYEGEGKPTAFMLPAYQEIIESLDMMLLPTAPLGLAVPLYPFAKEM